jgi:hypothetical protein
MDPASISSLADSVWRIMPASTVNSLSQEQLAGLTNNQVNSILNSPSFASFSSAIKLYAAQAASPTKTLSTDAGVKSCAAKLAGKLHIFEYGALLVALLYVISL